MLANAHSALDICKANLADIEARRAAFPFTTQIVDELRAEGFAPRVVYAEENDRRIGKQS